MGVFQVVETQVGDTSAEEEDIGSQLLWKEPMQLTPTVRETEGSVVTHESKDTQTEEGLEKGAMEKVKSKLDAVKAEVAQALTGIFKYMEQLKPINMSFESD